MNSFLVVFSLIVATALAAPASTPPKTLDQLAPLIKPAVIADATALIRTDSIRKLVRFGPFNLPAAKSMAMAGGHSHGGGGEKSTGLMSGGAGIGALDPWAVLKGNMPLAIAEFLSNSLDPEGFNVMHTVKEGLCKDCTVLAAKLDAVFENGTRADVSSGVYLHHIFTANIAERADAPSMTNSWMPFCSGSQIGSSVMSALQTVQGLFGVKTRMSVFGFGAVDEFKQWFTTPDGNFPSGFYLGNDDKLLMQGEIVNYRSEAQQLYIQFDIEYLPGKVGKMASTSFGTATSCSDGIGFTGNGISGIYAGKGVTIEQDGTIIAARGHMHDGGESMTVFINDKQVCISNATYGTTGEVNGQKWTTISKMSDCNDVISVKKGDIIKLSAAYDEKAHPVRQSDGMAQMEMGLVAFSFVAAK